MFSLKVVVCKPCQNSAITAFFTVYTYSHEVGAKCICTFVFPIRDVAVLWIVEFEELEVSPISITRENVCIDSVVDLFCPRINGGIVNMILQSTKLP